MRNRIVFYIAKLLWSQLRGGGSYEKIHQVISIVIRDYPLLPEAPDDSGGEREGAAG